MRNQPSAEWLIHIGMGEHGPLVTLGPGVKRVEVRPDMSVTVVGPGYQRVTSEANGIAILTEPCGVQWEFPTAKAYLDAADNQGVPVEMCYAAHKTG